MQTPLIAAARKLADSQKPDSLLTRGNPKVEKGMKKGYVTFILHLAPSKLSGYQACPMATAGCAAACLNTAGRGGINKPTESFNNIQVRRVARTLWYFERRPEFMAQLVREIRNGIRWAERNDLTPVFRLNGTSDIRFENVPVSVDGIDYPNVFTAFPAITFYDYTKIPNRRNLPPNYSLTFSLAESNGESAARAAWNGMNVAVVFRGALPEQFTLGAMTLPVVNGDETDLRFLDPRSCVVGLKAKGKAKRDTTGFVYSAGDSVRALPVIQTA